MIYSPVSLSGGTLTGTLHFANGLTPAIDFGNGWNVIAADASHWAIYNSHGTEAFLAQTISSSQVDLVIENGNVNVNQTGYGYQVGGVKVVGIQQAHITHDASGAANQATVNAILTALEAHGLIHS